MTSQISIRKLLKQELKQNSWMFGLTGLMHLLTGPVVFLLGTSNYRNWSENTAVTRYHRFFTDSFFIWQLFTMLGCLGIGIFIYRYLFSRRMVDLYHSVPISRSRLFLTKYLHGFFIWFLPFAVSCGSILLFYVIRSAGESFFWAGLYAFAKSFLLLLLCYFIFYHLFLTAVYLSGNVLNMFTNMAIIGSSVIGIGAAIYALADSHFDTFCYEPSTLLEDILLSLSPLTTPFSIYGFMQSGGLGRHVPLLIISIIVCLGLLDAAWILCMKRPSELAERGTESPRYIMLARIAGTILVGIAGALFFSSISTNDGMLAWGIFGAALGSFVTFGLLNSIYKTTIKNFFKHPAQLLACAVFSILLIVSFQLDWFGYDTYLPHKGNIVGMAIYSNQFTDGSTHTEITLNANSSSLYTTPQSITGRVPQTTLLTDIDACYDLLDTFVTDTNADDQNGGYSTYYAKIKLKSGRIYERRYRLYDKQYAKLKPFIESEDYIAANYKYSTGAFGYPEELTLELMNTSVDINPAKNTLSETIIRELMDAYYGDFAENFSLEHEASHMSVFSFSGQYHSNDGYNYFSLSVPQEYKRTLAVVAKYYPEHPVTIQSAEECTSLVLNTSYYDKFIRDGNTIDALYEYFGYPATDAPSEESQKNQDTDSDIIKAETVEIVEIASADGKPVPTAVAEIYAELNITDEETIKELFPLLYFGRYTDTFDLKEYIHLGYIRTLKGNSEDCYVRPGTLPKEVIEQLFNARIEYEY